MMRYNIINCITIRFFNRTVFFLLLLLLLLLLFQKCCTILDLCLKSEIINRFFSSWCLNDHIYVPDKIGPFLSGATTSIVVKNGTKKYSINNYKIIHNSAA